MTHSPSKIKVFESKDYSLFKLVSGNRPLNKKKIERIIQEIQAGNDVLAEVPVLVKEGKDKLEIMDGQHRYEVAKQLKRPVTYIIHKEPMSLHNVAKINSNTEKWKDTDFINCYVKAGDINYKKLKEFKESYGIAVGACLILLSTGTYVPGNWNSVAIREEFEQGRFVVKKHKDAVLVAETCKNFSEFRAWNSREFVIAICKLMCSESKEFQMDVLLDKFKKEPSRLQVQSGWKLYLSHLEDLYNIGNSKRRRIY